MTIIPIFWRVSFFWEERQLLHWRLIHHDLGTESYSQLFLMLVLVKFFSRFPASEALLWKAPLENVVFSKLITSWNLQKNTTEGVKKWQNKLAFQTAIANVLDWERKTQDSGIHLPSLHCTVIGFALDWKSHKSFKHDHELPSFHCTVIGFALDWESHKSLNHDHELPTLHCTCYRIDAWAIRRPWLTFVNALANSILGRFYTARTQRFASWVWPMVLRKLGIRWKWEGEAWFHYTKVLFVGVVGIAEMSFYLV